MILWDKTEIKFGTNKDTTRKQDSVIVKCEACDSELIRSYVSVKNTIKRSGKYNCHSCATKNNKFIDGCSKRASSKWQDPEYRNNNLAAVRSDEYREKKRKSSIEKWQDPEYRKKHLSEEAIKKRSVNSSNAAKKKWQDPEYRKKLKTVLSDRAKSQWADDSYRSNMSAIQSTNAKKAWAKKRDKFLETFRSNRFRELMRSISSSQSDATKKRISLASKELWDNELYKNRMIKVLFSPEIKQKRAKAIKLKKESEEYKHKLEKRRLSAERNFKIAASELNPEYDYSSVDYTNSKDKVEIICNLHGSFWQTPNNHTSKLNRCPACASNQSRLHLNIENYINSIGYKTITNDRRVIKPYELDIMISDAAIGIEVDGLYWHSYNKIETSEERKRHSNKVDMASAAGIRLICIREDEWNNKCDIVKSRLRNILGLSNRIYARKCKIVEVDNSAYKQFVESTHLQGYRSASRIYGLEYDNELVSVMSFNPYRPSKADNHWEIMRFSTALDTVVIGGASRLFTKFIKDVDPKYVLSYADRRYATGNVYFKIGLDFSGITRPNYVYVKNGMTYSRQNFQKHKLPDKLNNYDPRLTEAENMFNNGYRRLWDAGNFKFIYRR